MSDISENYEIDRAKYPKEPYYPWLILPWNAFDEEDDDEDAEC